jgi:glucan-binding YG repeat protein
LDHTSAKLKEKVRYYYLYSNGIMAHDTTIDGHYLDSSGAYIGDVDIESEI